MIGALPYLVVQPTLQTGHARNVLEMILYYKPGGVFSTATYQMGVVRICEPSVVAARIGTCLGMRLARTYRKRTSARRLQYEAQL
jgi:hypothetical protein